VEDKRRIAIHITLKFKVNQGQQSLQNIPPLVMEPITIYMSVFNHTTYVLSMQASYQVLENRRNCLLCQKSSNLSNSNLTSIMC